MKKVIIAPDSFKGTLSSPEVCKIISDTLKEKYSHIETELLPIADGGEGTSEAYLHIFGGKKVSLTVRSPLGRKIEASYAVLPDKTAVIETAAASGISAENEKNALFASTYGTGQMLLHAAENGAQKIILGLGGSATTDGGAGCLAALGAKFLDENGSVIPLGGIGLKSLAKIDLSGLCPLFHEIPLTVLCDVKNPLYGENGAAFVYAKQKGANENEIVLLDEALRHYSKIVFETLKKDFSSFEGTGAAGGMGFACLAFLKGQLKSGIDCILDAANFEKRAQSADLIITGEGKMDAQSLMGKAPFGIAKRSGKTKVIAIVGMLDVPIEEVRKFKISEVYETNVLHLPFGKVKSTAKEDLVKAVKKLEI